MVAGVDGYYNPTEGEELFAFRYDGEEAKWSRKVLRSEFAETQGDPRLATRLICAATLYAASEAKSYPPQAIGWGYRQKELEKYGEDVSVFLDIISERYTFGGAAAHPHLKPIMDRVSAEADRTPSGIARVLKGLNLDIAEPQASRAAALKLSL